METPPYTMDASDYRTVARLLLRPIQVGAGVLAGLALVIFALLFSRALAAGSSPSQDTWAGVVVVAATLAYMFVGAPWRVGRKLSSGVQGPTVTTVDVAGVHDRSPGVQTSLTWSKVRRIQETRSLIIFDAGNMKVWVPKHVFSTREEAAAFLTEARALAAAL